MQQRRPARRRSPRRARRRPLHQARARRRRGGGRHRGAGRARRRCTTRRRWPGSGAHRRDLSRTWRRWPSSTPRSSPGCRPRPRRTPSTGSWPTRERVRRYGMHGISHEYVAARGRPASWAGRWTSWRWSCCTWATAPPAAAIRDGRPVDTSMGLTPLEGLVMGTRGGDVDPGVLLHLLRTRARRRRRWRTCCTTARASRGSPGVHDFRDLAGRRRRRRRARRGRRTTSTATGSASTSAPTSPCSAAPTPWSSPPGSASTTPGVRADALAGLEPARASRSTRSRNADDGRGRRVDQHRRLAGDGAGGADRRGARDRPAGRRALLG